MCLLRLTARSKRRSSVYFHRQCIMKYNNIRLRLNYARTVHIDRSFVDEATAVITKTHAVPSLHCENSLRTITNVAQL